MRACRVVVSRELVAQLLHLRNMEATAFWMSEGGDLCVRLEESEVEGRQPTLEHVAAGDPLPLYTVLSKEQAPVVSWLVPVEHIQGGER